MATDATCSIVTAALSAFASRGSERLCERPLDTRLGRGAEAPSKPGQSFAIPWKEASPLGPADCRKGRCPGASSAQESTPAFIGECGSPAACPPGLLQLVHCARQPDRRRHARSGVGRRVRRCATQTAVSTDTPRFLKPPPEHARHLRFVLHDQERMLDPFSHAPRRRHAPAGGRTPRASRLAQAAIATPRSRLRARLSCSASRGRRASRRWRGRERARRRARPRERRPSASRPRSARGCHTGPSPWRRARSGRHSRRPRRGHRSSAAVAPPRAP